MDDNISELSSIIEEKIKPITTSHELTAGISYVNGLAGNINNRTLPAYCKLTGQDLPKLAMYALDSPMYQLIHTILSGTRSVESPGHPTDGMTSSTSPHRRFEHPPPNRGLGVRFGAKVSKLT
jgi:hypothetical protein